MTYTAGQLGHVSLHNALEIEQAAAVAAALAAQAAAEAAEAAAYAVPDAATAAIVANPATATATLLNSTFATPKGGNLARFIARAKTGAALVVTGLGDSIMGGTGATLGTNDYMTLVEDDLTARFTPATFTFNNRAVSGYTIAALGIGGQVAAALADKADLYIVSVGRNDVVADAAVFAGKPVQGYRLAQSMRAVEVLVREIRRTVPQADILLHTENPSTPYSADGDLRTYNTALQRLAAAYGCEFSDGYAAFVAMGDYSSYLLDGIHPSVTGHALHAATIIAALPSTKALSPRAPSSFAAAGGLYSPQLVDPAQGTFGWQVQAVPGGTTSGSWVNTGTWTGTNPAVTSTPTDYAEFTFTGTELACSVSTAAADAAHVVVTVDGAVVNADADLTLVPSTFQPLVLFAAGLSAGQHTVRLALISGTLRIYKAAWLLSPPLTGTGGLRRMKPGRYYTNPHDPGGALAVAPDGGFAAGQVWVVPIWVPTVTAFDRIACHVHTADATSTLTFGIYASDDYDQPAGLILTTAPITIGAAGWKEATISTTLQPGFYWLAVMDLVSWCAPYATNQPSTLLASSAQTVINPLNAYLASGQTVLPAVWASTAAATNAPLLALRAA